jgi:hypothetical protein
VVALKELCQACRLVISDHTVKFHVNAILGRHIGLTLPEQQNLAILPGKNAGHTPNMADLVPPFFPLNYPPSINLREAPFTALILGKTSRRFRTRRNNEQRIN